LEPGLDNLLQSVNQFRKNCKTNFYNIQFIPIIYLDK
jgi:hypothetical protein